MKKTIKRLIDRITYSNEFLFNLYRLARHDDKRYILDLSEKKKYHKLLKKPFFNYDGGKFYYFINTNSRCVYKKNVIDNIPVSYETVVNRPVGELLSKEKDDSFKAFFIAYFGQIRNVVAENGGDNSPRIIESIDNFFSGAATDFRDALQRILFVNQLLWQTGHRLNGLGRLDLSLDRVYRESGISRGDAKELIVEFLSTLHRDYSYKSNVLPGDTGQIIVLGGETDAGLYFCNDLTYIFIEAVKELRVPDPKTLLRVSENTPDDLLRLATESIATGCGSPLLSNDQVIIPVLEDIGYSKTDRYNYATSACWEPLCDGRSLEQNNIGNINYVKPLNCVLDEKRPLKSFDDVIDSYLKHLEKELEAIVFKVERIRFAYDPLMSLLVKSCLERGIDISEGGADYNNFGILSTGLGNAVDGLLNIKRIVFDEKQFDFTELLKHKDANFADPLILFELKEKGMKFGMDNDVVVSLTNVIIDFTNQFFEKQKNRFGGLYRFGLSSPNYISSSASTKASLDGRKDFEPFNVHISSSAAISFSDVVVFSSKLHYGIRNVNGNVCDLIISPAFINQNFEKFFQFLKHSIKQGFFQMQFNVIDSKTLIAAQKKPEEFKNLIVRVWGFSAFFVELPKEYQDLLIERALRNESPC